MPNVRVEYTTNIDNLLVADVMLDDEVILKITQGDNEQEPDIRRMAENAETVARVVVETLAKR